MNFLKITTTKTEFEIKATPAKIRIKQPKPKLKIKQKPAKMQIIRTPGKLINDQREAFSQVGNKTIMKLLDDISKVSLDICREAIARIAAEGTAIMRAGKSRSDIVREIIIEKALQKKIEINVDALPQCGAKIHFEEGEFEIIWDINPPQIDWEVYPRAEIEVEPHRVEIYTLKHPAIRIDFIKKIQPSGLKINKKL